MKKFPKLVQVDSRGQIVIPKDIRSELGIESGTGFWMFSIEKEGILLKKVNQPEFDDHLTDEVRNKANKIGVEKTNLEKTSKKYKKGKEGRLDIL